MFLAVIAVLALISFAFALNSLRRMEKDHKEISDAKKELEKGRVIFTNQDSSSSSKT